MHAGWDLLIAPRCNTGCSVLQCATPCLFGGVAISTQGCEAPPTPYCPSCPTHLLLPKRCWEGVHAYLGVLCIWCACLPSPLAASPINQWVMQESLSTRHECGAVVTQHLRRALGPAEHKKPQAASTVGFLTAWQGQHGKALQQGAGRQRRHQLPCTPVLQRPPLRQLSVSGDASTCTPHTRTAPVTLGSQANIPQSTTAAQAAHVFAYIYRLAFGGPNNIPTAGQASHTQALAPSSL